MRFIQVFFFFSYYEPIIFTIFLLYYLQKYLCARTYIFITTLTFNDGEIKKKKLVIYKCIYTKEAIRLLKSVKKSNKVWTDLSLKSVIILFPGENVNIIPKYTKYTIYIKCKTFELLLVVVFSLL